ncbi:hypothetical protein GCM10023169_40330 [Georgenia halophila]|uniref:Preprotein translocase subunit YajC n=1 Tax=Georgenia halophila TaxID=620889 RepID=A0ABP8LQN1_9MICO
MDPSILIFLAVMIGLMWFVSRRGKKQQAQARERLNEAMVPGTWVVTIGGFFGKVVEIDGDVVTLEDPSGHETIWLKGAVKEAKEPPFAEADEDTEESADADESGEVSTPVVDVEPTTDDPAIGGTTATDPTLRPGGPGVDEDGRLTDDEKRA